MAKSFLIFRFFAFVFLLFFLVNVPESKGFGYEKKKDFTPVSIYIEDVSHDGTLIMDLYDVNGGLSFDTNKQDWKQCVGDFCATGIFCGSTYCQSGSTVTDNCRKPGGYSVPTHPEKLGQKIRWLGADKYYTGSATLCTRVDNASFIAPIAVACGTKYTVDGQEFVGDVCSNSPYLGDEAYNESTKMGGEADNLCKITPVRHDTGFAQIAASFLNGSGLAVVRVTEPSLSEWFRNDPFDLDGGESQIKSLVIDLQPLTYGTAPYSQQLGALQVERVRKEDLETVRDFLKDDNVLYLSAFDSDSGHAVIVTDYGEYGDTILFIGIDSNEGQNLNLVSCKVSQDDASFYTCKMSYGFKFYDFLTGISRTTELRAIKDEYCLFGQGTKGSLCQGTNKNRVIEAAKLLGRNFSSPVSTGGQCHGMTEMAIKIGYLLDFVGENDVIPSTGCVSDLAGESDTFSCAYNSFACSVTWKIATVEGWANSEFNYSHLSSTFGMCGYDKRPVGIPESGNLAKKFGLTSIICDGNKHVVDVTVPNGESPFDSFKIIYTAEGRGSSSSLPQKIYVKVKGVWENAVAKIQSFSQSAVALLSNLASVTPSCTQTISGSNGQDLTVTRFSNYLFIHPSKLASENAFYALSVYRNGHIPGAAAIVNSMRLQAVDFIYPIGGSLVWYKKPKDNGDFIIEPAPMDPYTSERISIILGLLEDRGVRNYSCRLEVPSGSNLQRFISGLPPDIIISNLSATSTNTMVIGSRQDIRWTSFNLPVNTPLNFRIAPKGGNMISEAPPMDGARAGNGIATWPHAGTYGPYTSTGGQIVTLAPGDYTLIISTDDQRIYEEFPIRFVASPTTITAPQITLNPTAKAVTILAKDGPAYIKYANKSFCSYATGHTCPKPTHEGPLAIGQSCNLKFTTTPNSSGITCQIVLQYATSNTASSSQTFLFDTDGVPAKQSQTMQIKIDEPTASTTTAVIGSNLTIRWTTTPAYSGTSSVHYVRQVAPNSFSWHLIGKNIVGSIFNWSNVGKDTDGRAIPAGTGYLFVQNNYKAGSVNSDKTKFIKLVTVAPQEDDNQGTTPNATLKLTAPTTGSTIALGSSVTFSWQKTATTSPVTLYLRDSAGKLAGTLLKSSTANNYTWPKAGTIGQTTLLAGKYSVVLATSNGLLRDNKTVITLDEATTPPADIPTPTLKVSTFNPTWPAGSTQTVSWTSTGLTTTYIVYLNSGTTKTTLAKAVSGTSATFTVPATLAEGRYTLVVATSDGLYRDNKNVVTVTKVSATMRVIRFLAGPLWWR